MHKLGLSFSFIIFSQVLFATAASIECPNIKFLENSEGHVLPIAPQKLYLYADSSQLNTDSNWLVLVGPIKANSLIQAERKGEDVLKNADQNGRTKIDELGVPYCSYATGLKEVYITVFDEANLLKVSKPPFIKIFI